MFIIDHIPSTCFYFAPDYSWSTSYIIVSLVFLKVACRRYIPCITFNINHRTRNELNAETFSDLHLLYISYVPKCIQERDKWPHVEDPATTLCFKLQDFKLLRSGLSLAYQNLSIMTRVGLDSNAIPPGIDDMGNIEYYASGGEENAWLYFSTKRYYTNAFIVKDGKVSVGVSVATFEF